MNWIVVAQGTFANNADEKTVLLNANQAPTLASVANTSNTVGQSVSLALSASDPDGDTLSYSASGLPTGVSLNASSGLITGTPTAAGAYNVSAQASDGRGGVATASFVWTISAAPPAGSVQYVKLEALAEMNGNPWSSMTEFNLLDASGAVIPRTGWTVSADSAETQAEDGAVANAIDGDLLTIWHTEWSTGTSPPPHSFVVNLGSARAIGGFKYLPPPAGNPNGNIASWRLHTSVDGVNWTLAAQGTFANNSDEKTVLLNANQAPALASVANTSNTVGQSVSLALSASDPDGDTLSYAAGGLPTGVALNASSGLITGTPTAAGAYIVSAQASDGRGGVATTSFVWTISAANQTLPPVPVSPAPVVNYEYDAEGNSTQTVQAPGVSGFNFATQNTYDALNRLKDSTDAKAGKTQFAYDGQDRTLQVTDPRNLVTQYPRNGLGSATQLLSPDTGTASHTYDDAGNLKTRTDSRGVLATHAWDVLNRLTNTTYSQAGQTSLGFGWAYDQTGAGFSNGVGRLTSATHPAGSSQYAYDPQGRMLTATQRVEPAIGANAAQVSKLVTYGYDGAGNITSIVYPSGRRLDIAYANGRASALSLAENATAAANPLISQIQWQPFGAAQSWRWHMSTGTLAHERVFDTSGRHVRYRLGNVVRDVSYDAGNRITGYTHYNATSGAADPALDQSFGYDELGRLTGITTASASWSIGYDANGNRTSITLSGSPSTYSVATTSNRINSITNPARSFGYDNAGNTTTDGQFTASYDLSGRMATLVKAGITSTYSYNGFGQRVRKFNSTGTASTIIFVYDQQGQLLGEYDSAGKALREYVWLGNTPVAVFMPDPANAANPPLVFYVHADHIDTPRIVVDKNNNIRWRWMAEPFGVNAPETNPSNLGVFAFNLRFPGQYFDQESGLHHNWHRYYDASGGRFTQSDPIGLQGGINTYVYSYSQPTRYADPDGLQVIIVVSGQSTPRYDPRTDTVIPPTTPASNFTPVPPSLLCQLSPVACATLMASSAISAACQPSEADCRKEWLEAENICFEWIQELKSTRITARRRKVLHDLTGGSMGACKMGQVSQACGGNKVRW